MSTAALAIDAILHAEARDHAASLPLALHVPADMDKPVTWTRLLGVNAGYLAAQIDADYIEYLGAPIPDVCLIVDEGQIHSDGPHTNRRVSGILYPGRIVGDALVVGSVETMDGPDIGGLTPEQLQELAFRGIKAEDLP